MSILNLTYTGKSNKGGAGACYPDLFHNPVMEIPETNKLYVLVDSNGVACLVNVEDLPRGELSADSEGFVTETITDPKSDSYFKTVTSLANVRSGPRAAFSVDNTECWVIAPITHLELGNGSRGMVQIDYYSKVVDDPNRPTGEDNLRPPYTTLSRTTANTLWFAHMGVKSLYLASVWPFFYDDAGTHTTNIQFPSTSTITNKALFGDYPAYTKGIAVKQYEFKGNMFSNSPSSYYDLKPDYGGSFQTGRTVEVEIENSNATKPGPEVVQCIEGSAGSLQSYNYKTASISSGLQGESTKICFNPAIAKGHDRAYSIVHPINIHTNPTELFGNVLELNSSSASLNTAFFLGSAKGSAYYKQFFRVYPILKCTSDRVIGHDPVGYKADYGLTPVGVTGPHALFPSMSIDYVGPAIRVDYTFTMSDKSALADSVMYDNTDFAIRAVRYGYTYTATEGDWFVVSAHERGTLVIQIPPKGEDIVHIEGRAIEGGNDSAVIGYSHNNRTPEEHFYIDALTFVKHRFKYNSQVGESCPGTTLYTSRPNDNAFIVPNGEGSVATVLFGAIDITISSDNLAQQDQLAYTYVPATSLEAGRYKFTNYSPSGYVKVHCGLNMNLLSTKYVRDMGNIGMTNDQAFTGWDSMYRFDKRALDLAGLSLLTYTAPTDFDKRKVDQSLGSYHDTVVCVGEENSGTIFEGYDSSHIILGLNSQRGVIDTIFDTFAKMNIPYVCNTEGSEKVTKVKYRYYSVVLLMSNQSHYRPRRCSEFYNYSHSELFWMGSSMQFRYRYTQMPTHTNYQASNYNTCTAKMDYAGSNYGLGVYSASHTNTGRLTLLRAYAQALHSNSCELVYLETDVEAEFNADFVGMRTDLLNVSAKPQAFPFGAATATPTVYKMSGQTVQGLPVEYNIEVVLSTMNIVSKNVRKVGSISVDQVVFSKVHFYKDHVFSYTKDKVFAFNPSKGESPSLSDKKVSVCKFVHNGWGTHRYIDRFDKFIEGGLGDYIIQLGARRDE